MTTNRDQSFFKFHAPTPQVAMYEGPQVPNPVYVKPQWCVYRPFCNEPSYRDNYCRVHYLAYLEDILSAEEFAEVDLEELCEKCHRPVLYRSDKYGALCQRHYYRAYRQDKHPDQKHYRANTAKRIEAANAWRKRNPLTPEQKKAQNKRTYEKRASKKRH